MSPLPSESAVYRALVRAGLIEPVVGGGGQSTGGGGSAGAPMELWQMDVVGGFLLADGSARQGADRHR